MKLLSVGTNAKTAKSDKVSDEYLTAIMYLAPAQEAGGKSLCPGSTAGCRDGCLYTAGRGVTRSVQDARIYRARMYLHHRPVFMNLLDKEIKAFVRKCHKLNRKPAIRLNGTSDILWERFTKGGSLFERNPSVMYYDYTKIHARMYDKLPPNYHLTYSRSETTSNSLVKNLTTHGKNVAVVFSDDLPTEYLGIPVIDGTKHDLRFLDPPGVIVGLTALGKARRDTSGFVVPSVKEDNFQEVIVMGG